MKNQRFYVKDKGVALDRSMIITVFLPPDDDNDDFMWKTSRDAENKRKRKYESYHEGGKKVTEKEKMFTHFLDTISNSIFYR